MNNDQSDVYAHRTDTVDFDPITATTSGPVYLNEDPSKEPSPVTDEIVYEQGDEYIEGSHPEGSYQTWNPRGGEKFNLESSEAFDHFFPDEETVSPEGIDENRGYNTIAGSGW